MINRSDAELRKRSWSTLVFSIDPIETIARPLSLSCLIGHRRISERWSFSLSNLSLSNQMACRAESVERVEPMFASCSLIRKLLTVRLSMLMPFKDRRWDEGASIEACQVLPFKIVGNQAQRCNSSQARKSCDVVRKVVTWYDQFTRLN